MNVNLNETVTLSVETYERMKSEIAELKGLVKEKEIERYIMHPALSYGFLLMALAVCFKLLFWF